MASDTSVNESVVTDDIAAAAGGIDESGSERSRYISDVIVLKEEKCVRPQARRLRPLTVTVGAAIAMFLIDDKELSKANAYAVAVNDAVGAAACAFCDQLIEWIGISSEVAIMDVN
jgi:hypothetical protein